MPCGKVSSPGRKSTVPKGFLSSGSGSLSIPLAEGSVPFYFRIGTKTKKMNTRIKKVLLLATIMLFSSALRAQQQGWSLRECIRYARENNIQVQKSQLSVQGYEEDLQQSRAALFPSFSGSISQNYSNAKALQPDGGYEYKGLFSGRYALSASWTVFNGGRNRLGIRQAELQRDAQELATQQVQNDLEISITQAYMQILYAVESIKNNENILASSEAQLRQTKDFLDAGTITMSDYAQVEAQYSTYKYNLVQARNAYDSYMLQLKQLLELEYDEPFSVRFPQIDDAEVMEPIPDKYEVYRTALEIMPQVENSLAGIRLAELDRTSAKAAFLPNLAVTASLGTGNVYNQSPAFFSQLNNNFNQSVGLTLNIPIFSNRQNRTALRKAEIGIRTAQLDYTDTQKELLRTVETLHQDAVSAQSKFRAAQDQLRSTELSYRLVSEQFELGMRNTVELTTEKNNYANALQELLQAKYNALLSIKLLNFYRGGEISL